jgi:hypothetical protein
MSDDDTEPLVVKAYTRYSHAWVDTRAIWATDTATQVLRETIPAKPPLVEDTRDYLAAITGES